MASKNSSAGGWQRSDPEVKAWMKEHPDVVESVGKLYDALRGKSFEELLEIANHLGVDLAKLKDRLVTDIIKLVPESARSVIAGQGVLVPGKSG